ncbi:MULTISPECIES: beta-ketoacyl-ACP synthase III [unclassified Halorhodospira]|uniref:beta-ketoacyl-ACP synthase III n=1 Tax=unclassified Halorhodospira TaxID=2626748 RepID=UPI001EE7F49D|nr:MULTISPECIES: beta-ketoacyl-ACP synthase III [unclassified Halorhodospira]MCG5540222.1 beta-ketoacyl-ACP synthase III [Halorhodospira sp. M39old]MCG5545077.1 beta-ketoacyl-ACP synthase III [Halorhodospira sp. M38]
MAYDAYINAMGACLPNAPIDNEQMEGVLGALGRQSSRTRRVVLRNNGIRLRHYALDPETGELTHTNAQMTAQAVREAAVHSGGTDRVELLSCGTSSPDQLMPNHASMVHGELGDAPRELVATAGICLAGVTALKHAWQAVRGGDVKVAVSTGSELASTFMRSRYLQPAGGERTPEEVEAHPELAFEAEFLRWMLSDGAGAALLEREPSGPGPSLRIDWIETCSFAHELDPCMYAGAVKDSQGRLRSWRDYPDAPSMQTDDALAVKQDVRLLNEYIVEYTLGQGLSRVLRRRPLAAGDVDWFLPHYSSAWFREQVAQKLGELDFEIPESRWYTNLATRGNTGSASIYLMLEELFNSGRLSAGDRLLCFIPESGRFSTGFIHLTVVEP